MFEFKNVLIQLSQKNIKLKIYTVWGCSFSKFVLKLRVFSEEFLNLDNLLLGAANLNR